MDTTKTVTLRTPIKLGDVEYAELHLIEPTMKELRSSSKAGNSLDQLHALIQMNAKVPSAVVDMLCQRDVRECDDFFAQFATASLETPST